MKEIQEIHEEVFQLLMEEHEKDPKKFFFTVRKNNSSKRLDKGYWFHGNDDYLTVSFWSGFDWKNKTPNIYFEINKRKQCLFIISAKDNTYKLEFARNKLLPIIDLELTKFNVEPLQNNLVDVFVFELAAGDYIQILKDFIEIFKPKIDNAVRKKIEENESYAQEMDEYNQKDDIQGTQEIEDRSEGDRPIDFIWPADFKKNIERIKAYQRKRKLNKLPTSYYLKEIVVHGLPGTKQHIKLNIPKNSSWIFLTGENGSGKSLILKAITAGFEPEIINKYPFFNDVQTNMTSHVKHPDNNPIAFAAYGPTRLISTSSKDVSESYDNNKNTPWYGIFHSDGVLQGFEELQSIFKDDEIKLNNIVEFLEDMFSYSEKESGVLESGKSEGELIPQLARVNFEKFLTDGIISYQEKDNYNNVYEDDKLFDELASGVKSLLALIADILIKIIHLNKSEPDITNFEAVILIDEIDIHFHPSMQKQIVEILASQFPKVQFIVTTHSPVTLLGAPENSIFYKVHREVELGITVEKLDIDISNLLPNTILSSPIFGFKELIPENHEKGNVIRGENIYEETAKNMSEEDEIRKYFTEERVDKILSLINKEEK